MDTIYQVVNYLGIRAHKIGRTIFGNEAGAITLEWIVIAVALVVAAGVAAAAFKKKVSAELKHL